MCGICCRIRLRSQGESVIELHPYTRTLVDHRGPDSADTVEVTLDDAHLLFHGAVLWHQGTQLAQQPLVHNENVLLWNGDLYDDQDFGALSDSDCVMRALDACSTEADVFQAFTNMTGPYSVIYLNKSARKLYFGRDVLGRHSLLLAVCENGDLVIGSVLGATEYASCIEVPAIGIFSLDLYGPERKLTLYPWRECDKEVQEIETILGEDIRIMPMTTPNSLKRLASHFEFNFEKLLGAEVPIMDSDSIFHQLLQNDQVKLCIETLTEIVRKSVDHRVQTTKYCCTTCNPDVEDNGCSHSSLGILFSGGIDCTILAILADRSLDERIPIDLINVSFEKVVRKPNSSNANVRPPNYDTPDRKTAREALEELESLCPKRQWRLIEVDVPRGEKDDSMARIAHLVYPLNTVLDESLAAVLYFGSRGRGILADQPYTSSCRVLLIGSGADELFGGYSRHRTAYLGSADAETDILPYDRLDAVLEYDFLRLPSRNLARDDRVVGDHGRTVRAPYLDEEFVSLVRSLRSHSKCYHKLETGVGDKLLLRLLGFSIGLRGASARKKRAMQFGTRVADSKQNATDVSVSLSNARAGKCGAHMKRFCMSC